MINKQKIKIVKGFPPKTTKKDRIALDTEFFQMNKDKMHRPHGIFASLACTIDGKTVYIITDDAAIPEFLELVEDGVHIWHNAKFDITQIRRFADYPERKGIWDTMVVEQQMFAGYYNDFSLKDLARRWLGLYMEKETREQFETADKMTKEMIEYAALDVIVTWNIYQAQRAYADEGSMDIWKDVDRGALWAILDMNGMMMDRDKWLALAEEQIRQAQEIEAKYPELNLRSPAQVLKKVQGLNKEYRKLKSTGEKVLDKIADECEFARDVLSHRKLSKAASTYGVKFLDDIESDGRIYSDYKNNGASTGRLSSAKPNLENIPKDPRYRDCFIAAPGHVLIDADWSSQEPRIAAFLSQDKQMIQIFQEKKDIYIEAARLMFGWKLTKKDPRRNSRMKPTVLGACYGLTEFGMEVQYNVPREEGKELLDAFFDAFPEFAQWAEDQQGHEYVTTIMGRKYWLNPYTDKSSRNALNSPIQGSAGDALKIAAYRMSKRFRNEIDADVYDVWIVNLVHDEILVECSEEIKDQVITIMREVMLEVAEEMHPGIPADLEIGVGCSWAEAHQ